MGIHGKTMWEIFHGSFMFSRLPGRTETFFGHFLVAAFFFGFGMCLLLLCFYRAHNLPPGKTFAELHIPERNPLVLRRFSWTMMIATGLGIFEEAFGGFVSWGDPFAQMDHEVFYFSYLSVAICCFFESKGRLPPDTHRAALLVTLVGHYFMWNAHGKMKELPADASLHMLLGYINLAQAAVVAYSIRFTDSVFAYIAGWAMYLLQATWLLSAGLYVCCWDPSMHDITTDLVLQAVLITMAIVLVVALYGPESLEQDNPDFRYEFRVLKQNMEGEDEVELRGVDF